MSNTIQLTDRSNLPSSQVKQLKNQGFISGVVYGVGITSIPIVVNAKQLFAALKKNPKAILQAAIAERGQHPVLVQEVQKDMLTGKWTHVDFHQINMNESIDTKATIHFTGNPIGLVEGGILQTEVHEVEIRCMPDKLFAAFEVDISKLGIGDQLLVSDLSIPEGVEILTDASVMLIKVLSPDAPVAEEKPVA
ncbi:50S ribosomal protein L25 [Cohnella lupini]|uniref:Large ribosomal subunit protein bL25 n=1 Tax=Cohnella lupini TaxID=1294267 RepID=A0A3D9IC44_9BACL|nr:50S ribosomal protein L25 [Cohnella lupini]RED59220.1 LSU ribosomal protein L25P [Cohnella lupini]